MSADRGLAYWPAMRRHLDHRHAGAVGQHDRHLQQRADVAADVRFGVVGERLGAVAALQQERLAAGDLGQLGLQPVDLGRHGDRRHALQHRAHRLGLVGVPARLLRGRLGQRGVQPGRRSAGSGGSDGSCSIGTSTVQFTRLW